MCVICSALRIRLTLVQLNVQPSLDTVREVVQDSAAFSNPPNLVPIVSSIPAEFLTPSLIYLRVSARLVQLGARPVVGCRRSLRKEC